jgi:hypothetical protein
MSEWADKEFDFIFGRAEKIPPIDNILPDVGNDMSITSNLTRVTNIGSLPRSKI